MASNFSLTGKIAVVSGVLLLLSLGLCGFAGLGVGGINLTGPAIAGGLTCLALGVVGIIVSAIMAVVQAASGNRPAPTSAPPPSPPPPPISHPDDPQP